MGTFVRMPSTVAHCHDGTLTHKLTDRPVTLNVPPGTEAEASWCSVCGRAWIHDAGRSPGDPVQTGLIYENSLVILDGWQRRPDEFTPTGWPRRRAS